MEKEQELGAHRVSVLHIEPVQNTDFQRITSPQLECLGDTVVGVWQRLVTAPDRFNSIDTETLFGPMVTKPMPEMKAWADYIRVRYRWVSTHDAAAGLSGQIDNK